jgi:membrane-bound metal-dependent hydrolase YbcI (DUF457 family)
MRGDEHLAIGAVTSGLVLWGAQSVGLQLGTGTILVGALVAGLGSLAPDIDHPRSTISRGLPAELLFRGLLLLLLAVILVVILAVLGDFRGAFKILQSLSQTPLIQWGLVLIILALALIALSAISSTLFGHRGATHSLVFAGIATCIAIGSCVYLNTAWWYGLLFGWGWLLHLLADATTETGLPALFWPFLDSDASYR